MQSESQDPAAPSPPGTGSPSARDSFPRIDGLRVRLGSGSGSISSLGTLGSPTHFYPTAVTDTALSPPNQYNRGANEPQSTRSYDDASPVGMNADTPHSVKITHVGSPPALNPPEQDDGADSTHDDDTSGTVLREGKRLHSFRRAKTHSRTGSINQLPVGDHSASYFYAYSPHAARARSTKAVSGGGSAGGMGSQRASRRFDYVYPSHYFMSSSPRQPFGPFSPANGVRGFSSSASSTFSSVAPSPGPGSYDPPSSFKPAASKPVPGFGSSVPRGLHDAASVDYFSGPPKRDHRLPSQPSESESSSKNGNKNNNSKAADGRSGHDNQSSSPSSPTPSIFGNAAYLQVQNSHIGTHAQQKPVRSGHQRRMFTLRSISMYRQQIRTLKQIVGKPRSQLPGHLQRVKEMHGRELASALHAYDVVKSIMAVRSESPAPRMPGSGGSTGSGGGNGSGDADSGRQSAILHSQRPNDGSISTLRGVRIGETVDQALKRHFHTLDRTLRMLARAMRPQTDLHDAPHSHSHRIRHGMSSWLSKSVDGIPQHDGSSAHERDRSSSSRSGTGDRREAFLSVDGGVASGSQSTESPFVETELSLTGLDSGGATFFGPTSSSTASNGIFSPDDQDSQVSAGVVMHNRLTHQVNQLREQRRERLQAERGEREAERRAVRRYDAAVFDASGMTTAERSKMRVHMSRLDPVKPWYVKSVQAAVRGGGGSGVLAVEVATEHASGDKSTGKRPETAGEEQGEGTDGHDKTTDVNADDALVIAHPRSLVARNSTRSSGTDKSSGAVKGGGGKITTSSVDFLSHNLEFLTILRQIRAGGRKAVAYRQLLAHVFPPPFAGREPEKHELERWMQRAMHRYNERHRYDAGYDFARCFEAEAMTLQDSVRHGQATPASGVLTSEGTQADHAVESERASPEAPISTSRAVSFRQIEGDADSGGSPGLNVDGVAGGRQDPTLDSAHAHAGSPGDVELRPTSSGQAARPQSTSHTKQRAADQQAGLSHRPVKMFANQHEIRSIEVDPRSRRRLDMSSFGAAERPHVTMSDTTVSQGKGNGESSRSARGSPAGYSSFAKATPPVGRNPPVFGTGAVTHRGKEGGRAVKQQAPGVGSYSVGGGSLQDPFMVGNVAKWVTDPHRSHRSPSTSSQQAAAHGLPAGLTPSQFKAWRVKRLLAVRAVESARGIDHSKSQHSVPVLPNQVPQWPGAEPELGDVGAQWKVAGRLAQMRAEHAGGADGVDGTHPSDGTSGTSGDWSAGVEVGGHEPLPGAELVASDNPVAAAVVNTGTHPWPQFCEQTATRRPGAGRDRAGGGPARQVNRVPVTSRLHVGPPGSMYELSDSLDHRALLKKGQDLRRCRLSVGLTVQSQARSLSRLEGHLTPGTGAYFRQPAPAFLRTHVVPFLYGQEEVRRRKLLKRAGHTGGKSSVASNQTPGSNTSGAAGTDKPSAPNGSSTGASSGPAKTRGARVAGDSNSASPDVNGDADVVMGTAQNVPLSVRKLHREVRVNDMSLRYGRPAARKALTRVKEAANVTSDQTDGQNGASASNGDGTLSRPSSAQLANGSDLARSLKPHRRWRQTDGKPGHKSASARRSKQATSPGRESTSRRAKSGTRSTVPRRVSRQLSKSGSSAQQKHHALASNALLEAPPVHIPSNFIGSAAFTGDMTAASNNNSYVANNMVVLKGRLVMDPLRKRTVKPAEFYQYMQNMQKRRFLCDGESGQVVGSTDGTADGAQGGDGVEASSSQNGKTDAAVDRTTGPNRNKQALEGDSGKASSEFTDRADLSNAVLMSAVFPPSASRPPPAPVHYIDMSNPALPVNNAASAGFRSTVPRTAGWLSRKKPGVDVCVRNGQVYLNGVPAGSCDTGKSRKMVGYSPIDALETTCDPVHVPQTVSFGQSESVGIVLRRAAGSTNKHQGDTGNAASGNVDGSPSRVGGGGAKAVVGTETESKSADQKSHPTDKSNTSTVPTQSLPRKRRKQHGKPSARRTRLRDQARLRHQLQQGAGSAFNFRYFYTLPLLAEGKKKRAQAAESGKRAGGAGREQETKDSTAAARKPSGPMSLEAQLNHLDQYYYGTCLATAQPGMSRVPLQPRKGFVSNDPNPSKGLFSLTARGD